MQPVKQESNNNNHHNHPSSSKKKIINGDRDRAEIVELMTEKNKQKSLIEPGSHNLLIYDDLRTFREIYSEYSKALLPENEIIVIGTQYETINNVKNNLRLSGSGLDVERYRNQGTLLF